MGDKKIDLSNVLGKPKTHKGIEIYPVKIKDFQEFSEAVRCLMIEKNKIKDIEILKMSYLKFIFTLSMNGHGYLIESLEKLLGLVLKQEYSINTNDKGRLFFVFENGSKWTENDFDKVKKIVLKQNLIDFKEEMLNPELEKKLNEAREFMNRRNGRMADLEQQIVAYHCAFKMSYEEISELTVYQFSKGLQRMNLIKEADAVQNAKLSGFVTFKEDAKLPNWLSYIEETDPSDDLIISKGKLDKIAVDNGIVNS